ncbi:MULTISPECIES: zeta toxin family protein [unclassified Pseudomonas]|uniref:zeta toxin family protein n=1 Tax=unclassified Pseudomonas TaxID=196821 RepID=UPI0002705D13|nr:MULTISPECIES: zeta toxin family protein [unclassified Pseudomonas]EJM78861.1 Zeta toxin [Pseudomonas sp. GM67]MBD9545637.1 zeta toxin family protein [Pseudomonas sp. PDM01]
MSAAPNYTYTQEQVTAAFDEIKATLFTGITAEATPKMLIVAGLQGSGKTYLLEKSLLPSGRYKNYVRLYLPEYRKKHPQYTEMIKLGVLHAYEHTEAFVREVSAKIFAQAFASKLNIIMECAFDSLDFAAFPPTATAAGYQFETHIVGCTREFAHVSSIKRALNSLENQEMERFLTGSTLAASMRYAQAIILAIETASKAISGSQITVYERGFGVLKERAIRAQSTYTLEADGTLTKTTTLRHFEHIVYSRIIDNPVFAVNGHHEIIKECHLALLKIAGHAQQVPSFVYNDLYACIVRYANR